MSDRKTKRTSFRTGDMAAVAIAFLVVLTPLAAFVLSEPAAPAVDAKAGLVVFLPFLAFLYLGMLRAAMMKVRIDDRGVFVRNFWSSRTYGWDEFDEFVMPGDGVTSSWSSARLRTTKGKLKPMNSIQAKNLSLIMGRKDRAAERLVREMSDAANEARARSGHESGKSSRDQQRGVA